MTPFSSPTPNCAAAPIESASMKPGPSSKPSDSAHRSAGIVRDWEIRRGYQNEQFEHPRTSVRRASGLVLTRYSYRARINLTRARSPVVGS